MGAPTATLTTKRADKWPKSVPQCPADADDIAGCANVYPAPCRLRLPLHLVTGCKIGGKQHWPVQGAMHAMCKAMPTAWTPSSARLSTPYPCGRAT